ncbi:hypothetical protein HDE_05179 [Halotydeus destructor]|nr:hypothetical protein HDE_05179 [Halotydeus destructor]
MDHVEDQCRKNSAAIEETKGRLVVLEDLKLKQDEDVKQLRTEVKKLDEKCMEKRREMRKSFAAFLNIAVKEMNDGFAKTIKQVADATNKNFDKVKDTTSSHVREMQRLDQKCRQNHDQSEKLEKRVEKSIIHLTRENTRLENEIKSAQQASSSTVKAELQPCLDRIQIIERHMRQSIQNVRRILRLERFVISLIQSQRAPSGPV